MHILIVDDEPELLRDMQQMLAPTHYELETCQDPLEALRRFRQRPCDVLITDYRMPGMNGLELLAAVRALDPRVRVILITAFGDLETAIAAINLHAYAFIPKPVDFRDLMEKLRGIEAQRRGESVDPQEQAALIAENNRLKSVCEALIDQLQHLGERKS